MKSQSLFKQLLVGFMISLFASISIDSLSLVFSYTDSLNLSIASASIFYIVSILKNSHLKTGRIVVFTSISAAALVLCSLASPSLLVMAFNLLAILLVRIIYCQLCWRGSIFHAGLIALGLFIASGVLLSTNSWFLSFWCFFFIQSLIVCQSDISLFNHQKETQTEQAINQRFFQAKSLAELAIQQISNRI